MTPASPTTAAPNTDRATHSAPADLVQNKLVLTYFMLSLAFALAGMLAGMFYSLQFLQVYPFAGIELCSPGRWRIVHTTIVTYGFVGNAALAALNWMVPRLTRRAILTPVRSWLLLAAWQTVLAATITGILLGKARAIPWSETPVWIAPVTTLVLVLISLSFLGAILKCYGPRPIALWYLMIPLVTLAPTYALGVFLPQPFGSTITTSTNGVSLDSMTALFVMPLGYGILYYFVPRVAQRPIWSPRLARIGWVIATLAFPLGVVCEFLHQRGVFSRFAADAIPTLAVVTIAGTVIPNVVATAIARLEHRTARASMRWFVLGTLLYGTGCVQSIIALTPRFGGTASSDWTIAQSHLIVFGTLGFWLFGVMVYLLPRLLGVSDWHRPSWHAWHFWLTGLGLIVMFVDLATAGAVQQNLWRSLAPWEQSLSASVPFWIVRAGVGFVIIAGQMVLLCHIAMTTIHGRRTTTPEAIPPEPSTPDTTVPQSQSVLAVGTTAILFALAAVAILRWSDTTTAHRRTFLDEAQRGVSLDFVDLAERFPKQFRESFPAGPTIESYAAALKLGRSTYEAEACWNCHTQRIRAVDHERTRWGPASRAAEYDTAALRLAFLATRRIGPDLSREAARRSNDWHLAHFYRPTDVVPTSVMPAYPWFFDADDYPNRHGLAIITYMQWLGSDRPENPDNVKADSR